MSWSSVKTLSRIGYQLILPCHVLNKWLIFSGVIVHVFITPCSTKLLYILKRHPMFSHILPCTLCLHNVFYVLCCFVLFSRPQFPHPYYSDMFSSCSHIISCLPFFPIFPCSQVFSHVLQCSPTFSHFVSYSPCSSMFFSVPQCSAL